MVEVTQADREAAASVAVLVEMRELILAGRADHHAEPFARHRIAAENAAQQEITALRARIAEDQAQIAALTTYRENLRDEVIELRARIAELEVEVEVANDPSPYCPICGSCGEDGCCSAQRCLYSDDKLMARIAELEKNRA